MEKPPGLSQTVPSMELSARLDVRVREQLDRVRQHMKDQPHIDKDATIFDCAERRALFNEVELQQLLRMLGLKKAMDAAKAVNRSLRRVYRNSGLLVGVAPGANDERPRLMLFNEPHVHPRT